MIIIWNLGAVDILPHCSVYIYIYIHHLSMCQKFLLLKSSSFSCVIVIFKSFWNLPVESFLLLYFHHLSMCFSCDPRWSPAHLPWRGIPWPRPWWFASRSLPPGICCTASCRWRRHPEGMGEWGKDLMSNCIRLYLYINVYNNITMDIIMHDILEIVSIDVSEVGV